jgi:glycosyltransferase involved in cell wall biosynthesis
MFQYAIDMDVSRPVAIADGSVSLACMFRHFNRAPIMFTAAEGKAPPLSLGYRLYRARARALVHEGRLTPSSPTARPEQWLPFEINLPSQVLSDEEEFEILVDLVSDDDVWFHERGHHGNRFRLNFVEPEGNARRAVEQAEAKAALPPPTPTRVNGREAPTLAEQAGGGLLEMLRSYSFADYAAVQRLNRVDEGAQTQTGPLPPELLAQFNARRTVSHDDRFALTSLMDYFMRTRREDVDRLIGKRSGRFALIRRFFEISHQLAGEPGDYFPADLVADLNAFVLQDGVFELPLSRLMLWHWLEENRPLSTAMERDRDDVFWWWVTGAMPANGIPDVFAPDPVRAHLGGGHETFRGRSIELSRFAFRAWRESEQLQLRYDLKTAAGLIAYSFDFIIHNASNPINRHFIGSSASAYWREPLLIAGVGFSRFEVALAAQCPDFRILLAEPDQDAAGAVRAAFDRLLPLATPDWLPLSMASGASPDRTDNAILLPPAAEPRRASAKRAERSAREGGIMMAGLLGSQSGLGVNLKMSCQTFQSLDAPFSVYDVARRRTVNAEAAAGAEAALFHVNADMIGEVLATEPAAQLSRRRRIGFFLWELDVLPESHRFGASLVDEIWAPSRFVAQVYADATARPVKLVKKFITMPDIGPAPPRQPGPYRFLTSFDFHSGVERKNPFAVVRAFQAAFPITDRDAALTVKTTEFLPGHWGDANNQWQIIQEAAARDPRISIVVDAMPEREFFALIRSHDCVVSSHRAEGFGYLPAYALAYKRAVIVTDYSGTTDFCTAETSWPVACRKVGVRPPEFIVEIPGAQWAEIDHDHLVDTMRRVREDRAETARRASRGARLIETEYSLASHAARYREAMDWGSK